MKKLLALLLSLTFVFALAACGEEEGDYEPGTYFGYTEGHRNTTAVVFVNENGMIEDIFVDAAYTFTEGEGEDETLIATTKMSLDEGCGYHMHRAKEVQYDDNGDCFVEGELMWHEQVQVLVDEIIAEQGMPEFDVADGKLTEDNDDAVSGVSITVTSYITAIEEALEKAEK